MKNCLLLAALVLAVPRTAQAEPKSVLAPVEAQVRAVVMHVQPATSFATGPGIFLGQYRTANHVYQPRNAAGERLPPQVQLGPRPGGGFYLQLNVAKSQGAASVQTVPPSLAQPWTTVTSTYPLPDRSEMIVMTWEATTGAPHSLAARIRSVLLRYIVHLKS